MDERLRLANVARDRQPRSVRGPLSANILAAMKRAARTGLLRPAVAGALLLALLAAPRLAESQEASAPISNAMELAQSGNLRAAIKVLEAFCAGGDAPDAAFGALGALHVEDGRPEKALEILLPLTQTEELDPAVLYNAGRASEALGRFTDAVGFYRISISVDGFSPAVRALGMLLGRLERSGESYELLATWLEANSNDYAARIAAAAGAVDLELADEAESLIQGLPPDAPAIRLLQGRIHLLRNDPWGALGKLQPLADQPPPALELDLRRSLADAWLQVGDPEAAIEQIELIPPGNPSDTVQLANAYSQSGRIRKAVETLAPLAEPLIGSAPPTDPGKLALGVLIDFGRYLQAAGDSRRALSFLQLAAEIGPDFPEAFKTLADVLEANGRSNEAATARARYETLTTTTPPGPTRFDIAADADDQISRAIREALELAFSGETYKALERLDQQLDQAPGDPRPAYVKSSILLQGGHTEEALAAADRALEIAPGHADGLYQRGVVLLALQRIAEAEDLFLSALEAAPEHPAALADYAALLMSSGRSDEAADLLTRLVEQRPNDSRLLAMLGRSLLDARRFKEAEAPLRRAASLDPRNAVILLDLASALWEANRPDEAERQAREATALIPHAPAGHRLLGALLLWRGDYLEAAASLEKAIANGGEDAALHLELARAWEGGAGGTGDPSEEQTRLERAEAAYRRAGELEPEHAGAAYGLAQVLRKLGRHDEATAQMDRYRELYERDQRETREQGLGPSAPDDRQQLDPLER